ncbi:MAG: NFACT RNA binding domain-containing protein [Cyclonatronaceae bacterium]
MDYVRKQNKINKLVFFPGLQEQRVDDVGIAESDRLVSIHFANGMRLFLVLYGSGANVLLVEKGVVLEAFKNPEKIIGTAEPQPRPPVSEIFSPTGDLYKDILQINPLLPRTFLKDILLVQSAGSHDFGSVSNVAEQLREILLLRFEPGLNPDGIFNPWPVDVLPRTGKEVFGSVNQAVCTAWYMKRKNERFNRKYSQFHKLISGINDKYKNRLYTSENEEISLARVEQNEKFGHLLMAHLHVKPESPDNITVPDLYSGGNVRIPLDPAKSMAENAAWYYQKARKAKKSMDIAIGKRHEMQQKAHISEKLLESLIQLTDKRDPESLDKWVEQNEAAMEKLGLHEKEVEGKTFPFRRMQIGSYEIWIGKSSAGNDELLRASHKEDIWMHARGVAGSHLIIRMNRSATYPDKKVLEQVAGVAAWMSKARTTGLAPVIYAKRKHVRKPKGAAPGLAVVDREQVLLVKPELPEAGSR